MADTVERTLLPSQLGARGCPAPGSCTGGIPVLAATEIGRIHSQHRRLEAWRGP